MTEEAVTFRLRTAFVGLVLSGIGAYGLLVPGFIEPTSGAGGARARGLGALVNLVVDVFGPVGAPLALTVLGVTVLGWASISLLHARDAAAERPRY